MSEMAAEIVELVLTKLSRVPVVGDSLEAMTPEAYDKLEEELEAVVGTQLLGCWSAKKIMDEILADRL